VLHRVALQAASSPRKENKPMMRKKKTRRMRSSREETQRMRKKKKRRQRMTKRAREAMKRKRMLPRSKKMLTRMVVQRVEWLQPRVVAQEEALISPYLRNYLAISHIIWGFKKLMMTEWMFNKTTLSPQKLNHELNLKKKALECLLKED
jgi:hypothetical protein